MSSIRIRAAAAKGFTLIEVMIALLIGLIGIVVIMQTFAVSEGFKRAATSGTDAQINGGTAMYMLQRELRMAGYGMNSLVTQGCPSVRVWDNNAGVGIDMHLVPFEINPAGIPAGDANTDTLLIAYGTSSSFVSGIALQVGQSPNAMAPLQPITNFDSFQNGDLFVSVAPGLGAGGNPSCVMHEATATWSTAGNCSNPPASPGVVRSTRPSRTRSTRLPAAWRRPRNTTTPPGSRMRADPWFPSCPIPRDSSTTSATRRSTSTRFAAATSPCATGWPRAARSLPTTTSW